MATRELEVKERSIELQEAMLIASKQLDSSEKESSQVLLCSDENTVTLQTPHILILSIH